MTYIKRWLEYYEDLFPISPNQDKFIENLCEDFTAPAKLLSVECGPALLSQKLHNTHPDLTVTDSHMEFISIINTRQEGHENAIHAFNLQPADIARYLGKDFFNVAVCCNSRLIFMKEKTSIKKFLFDVKMLLSDHGYLVLDLINFSKYDFSQTKIELAQKSSGRATLYSSIIKDSDDAQYKLYQYVVNKAGKLIEETKNEVITPISYETLKQFAEELKFSSAEFYGDYFRTPFKKDDDKIICVLRK